MNFKHIADHFGERVHVWGCCGYIDHNGTKHDIFLPVKRLKELQPIAAKITIVAQSYGDNQTFYIDTFETAKLFTE